MNSSTAHFASHLDVNYMTRRLRTATSYCAPILLGNKIARHLRLRAAAGTCIWARLKLNDWFTTRLRIGRVGLKSPPFSVFRMRRFLVVAGQKKKTCSKPISSLILKFVHRLSLLPQLLYNGSRVNNWASTRVLPGGI